jgi:hypothetical protein
VKRALDLSLDDPNLAVAEQYIAGERFAPRGVYCFGDHHAQAEDADVPGAAQLATWKAVKDAGFDYPITSVLPGDSRILFRDGDFVVLNEAGRWHSASHFVRGDPATFASAEKKSAEAGQPGWLVGAIDCPIHGCPIYVGRPYDGKNPQPRINAFYDDIQRGGATGKLLPATPRTIARYARLIADRARPASAASDSRAPVVHRAAPDRRLLVEAEGFEEHGGWLLDTQFAELMGSPFLLAHGLGEAVKDAAARRVGWRGPRPRRGGDPGVPLRQAARLPRSDVPPRRREIPRSARPARAARSSPALARRRECRTRAHHRRVPRRRLGRWARDLHGRRGAAGNRGRPVAAEVGELVYQGVLFKHITASFSAEFRSCRRSRFRCPLFDRNYTSDFFERGDTALRHVTEHG